MARINLLPWREEQRKQRQKEFTSMLGLAAATGALIAFLIVMYYNGQISGQQQRNTYLKEQITIVEGEIKEIEALDAKKQDLLRRKEVIERLQASRSQMVHMFDELVRTIPDGVRLDSVQQVGTVLTLTGFAQSNARVSTYMRQLDASPWMTSSDLSIIEVKGSETGLPHAFTLKVTLENPGLAADSVEGGEAGNATQGGSP